MVEAASTKTDKMGEALKFPGLTPDLQKFSLQELKEKDVVAKIFPFENHFIELLDKMEAIPHGAKEVFLWELVESATNSLRLIRLESLVDKTKLDPEPELFTEIVTDPANGSLSIIDSGIGMTEDDLCRLCTLPEPILLEIKDNMDKCLTNGDLSCLYSGECGVGLCYYAAFMVAHRVVITTRHNGHDQYVWESTASERSFSIARDTSGDRLVRGTKVTLFLKDEHIGEYCNLRRLRFLAVVYTYYTDLCPYPIYVSSISQKRLTRLMRMWRTEDHEKDLMTLQQEFEGLRKVFVKVLDSRVQSVVVHDRVYDLPYNLSVDRKTFEINPRSPIMKKLRSDAESNPEDEDGDVDEMIEEKINFQYVVGVGNIGLYDSKYGTNYLVYGTNYLPTL